MTDDSVLIVRALDAMVRWTMPAHVCAQLRDGPLADLVVAEPFDASVEATFSWRERDGGYLCVNEGEHLFSTSLDEVLAETFIAMNRLAATSVEHERLVLHAGVAAPPGRAAVAFCGASGAGKSTATAAAARAGWTFVADEVCAVDGEQRTVRPYLRPVGLRAGGAAALGATAEGSWSAWRAPVRATSPVELGLVVLVQRRPGDVEAERLSPPDALERLSDHTLASTEHERAMFRRLAELVRRVPVIELRYEHAVDAIAWCQESDDFDVARPARPTDTR